MCSPLLLPPATPLLSAEAPPAQLQGTGPTGGRLYALRALGSAAAAGVPGAKEALLEVAAAELAKGPGARRAEPLKPPRAPLPRLRAAAALRRLANAAGARGSALCLPTDPVLFFVWAELVRAVKKKKAGWLGGGGKGPEPAAADGSGGIVNEPHRGALSALRAAVTPTAWEPPPVRPPSAAALVHPRTQPTRQTRAC